MNYHALPGEPLLRDADLQALERLGGDAAGGDGGARGVGINEVQNFGKYRVTGPKARAWLDRIMAGRIPKPGRLTLTPMLAESGKIIGDFTVSCLSETEFQLTASYGAQGWHGRWFEQHMEDGVRVENISDTRTGFQIAGPKARELLARVTRSGCVGRGVPVHGREADDGGHGRLHRAAGQLHGRSRLRDLLRCGRQRQLWHTLWAAGQDLGLRPFGMRAMMSLRLDKFFGSWGREFSPDYTPARDGARPLHPLEQARGLDRQGGGDEGKGRGAKAQALRLCRRCRRCRCGGLGADLAGGRGGGLLHLGRVQSHFTGKSVAQGFVPADRVKDGLKVEIEILGERRPAVLVTEPLFDADGARMRG